MLMDTGPLVALLDADDPDHRDCKAVLERLRAPLVTTWPVFVEAMHLVGRRGGWKGQESLWSIVERGVVRLEGLDDAATTRSRELMGKYHDVPMDLADASLVALAEQKRDYRVFTLDSDFHLYRLHRKRAFQVVP